MQHQAQRVALVTGASKAAGFEIARQIGRAGARVLLGVQDTELGKNAAQKLRCEGIDAHFILIDLLRPATLQAAAQAIEADYGRLDVLVNNAGMGDIADGPPGQASIDAVRRIFETNVFGTLAVTQAMLPLLRRSMSARIVNVSGGASPPTPGGEPSLEFTSVKRFGYNASRAAVNMLTVQLAAELAGTSIKVDSADPGFAAGDLNGRQGGHTPAQGAAEAIRLALLSDDRPTGGLFSAPDGNA